MVLGACVNLKYNLTGEWEGPEYRFSLHHGAMYCVSRLQAFSSYGHCLNLHCPDKGRLTVRSLDIESKSIAKIIPFFYYWVSFCFIQTRQLLAPLNLALLFN